MKLESDINAKNIEKDIYEGNGGWKFLGRWKFIGKNARNHYERNTKGGYIQCAEINDAGKLVYLEQVHTSDRGKD